MSGLQIIFQCVHFLDGFVWAQEEDVWKWRLEDRGVFSVKSSYAKLEDINFPFGNILPPDVPIVCTFCDRMPESSTHLFLHCDIAQGVWLKMMGWLDCYFLIPTNMFVHWKCWDERYRNDRIRKGLRLIWHTTIWVLRKARNNKIFNNWNGGVDEIVEEIKIMSWRWMLERTNSL
ncbi:hypothetical protein MTR_5g048020 [Medicago truncatula]|uniref:Reverse transcriptase zinc-binding domain-containing protein n=1 Tax=Medicago truncatula TaxID=3880 RepID=G7JZ85_MEDTR|nr:hypothetical protein MTR_5g048020 [Medicago truncatula]